MDLYFNRRSLFTRWAIAAGALQECFVVVDVGVLGGENPRWRMLGDYLVVHGFDANEAAIDYLKQQNAAKRNLHYYPFAIGNEDGERTFYFNSANPSSSSFYKSGRPDEERRIPIRKLDTLLAEGIISAPDFLKIDVEGFESDVIGGARETLSRLLGAEIETSFNISSVYPESHFVMMQQMLLRSHLIVFDLNFNRVPRAGYQIEMERTPKDFTGEMGRPATVNALFCRDPINETDHSGDYFQPPQKLTIDQIIKTMMICELHGLNDIAYEIACRFRDHLTDRFDVDKARALLVDPFCRRFVDNSLRQKFATRWLSFRRRVAGKDRLP